MRKESRARHTPPRRERVRYGAMSDKPPRAARRRRLLRGLAVALALCGTMLWLAVRSWPLAPPPPYVGALPQASPPPEMAAFALPTGVTHRSAAFAFRGGSLFEARDFAMTAVLVRHPRGDFLLDAGLGTRVAEHLAQLPWAFRAITRYTRARTAAAQLEAAGYDRARLRGILLTHAHWDHASGVGDLSGVPVWLNDEERRFVDTGGYLTAALRTTPGVRFQRYAFESGPYLGYPRSYDVYGDGSLVLVPAPGHTPGSIIAFLNLPSGQRYVLLGDLAWQREGVTQLEERPWPFSLLGDDDRAQVRDGLRHLHALWRRFPSLLLAPAHDARGFASLPRL